MTPATFLEFLRQRIERGAFSTDDTLASVLPLVRQTLDVHDLGRVAPLRGLDHLKVEGIRIWFEAARSPQPASAGSKLRGLEKPSSLSFEIYGKGEVTEMVGEAETRYTNLRIGKPGAEIASPVYLPGYIGWEHEIGQHDPVTDVFSLGMILASLALGLDFTDPNDLESFVAHRANLFDLEGDLHPVLAKAIVRMTELDRHKRAQDLAGILHNLENYRDQPVDVAVDLSRARVDPADDRGRVLLDKLRERLFEISRRNRLLYHRATLNTLNLTFASVPLLFDVRSIRPEQLLTWQPDFAKHLLSGEPIPLGRYLRFEDAPYISGVLDHIIAESKRDQAEFGFTQMRLVLCFLRWHNLKESKEERIETPLVLLPVQLSRRKGVRDVYVLQANTTEAEINPVLRFHLRQIYGIELPESIDLSETTLDELHEDLTKAIQSSEPGVSLNKIDRPQIQLIHDKAKRRLDQYQRKLDLRGRGLRSFADVEYSYDPANFAPLGLKLFQTRVRPSKAPLGDLIGAKPRVREFAVPDADERGRMVAQFGATAEANPYAWDFDLCSITLGNFKYRKMSLVRDYDALLEKRPANGAFDSIFTLKPREAAPAPRPVPPLDKRFPVVSCDPTQAASIAQAGAGRSFIIQGPPGTGKSQTITNLIADYIAAGKRVLFVCEKRAAIDVVYQRLKQQGLDELCSLIHDSQQDKKAFIQDLKKTYESFLGEAAKEETDWPARRDQILELLRKELGPLERFDAAMRAAPESIGLPLRRLLQRRLELSDIAPAPKQEVPDYAAWTSSREIVDRLVASLKEVERSGVFSRHPLSLLSPKILKADRPQDAVTAGLENIRMLLRKIQEAISTAGIPEGSCETLADASRVAAFAVSVLYLAERGLYGLTDAQGEPRKALMKRVLEHRARLEALEKARTQNKHWTQKLPREEVEPVLALARSVAGPFAFLKPSWWRLRGILNARYEFRLHVVRPSRVDVLEALKREYEIEDSVEAGLKAAKENYGIDESLDDFARRVVAAGQAAAELPGKLAAFFASSAQEAVPVLAALRPSIDEAVEALDELLIDGATRKRIDVEDDLDRIEEAIDLLSDFLPCLVELEKLPPELARAFRRLPVDSRQIEAGMADRSLETAFVKDRSLARFAGAVRERHLSRIERLHREWQSVNAKTLRSKVRDRFLDQVGRSSRPNEGLSAEEKAWKKSYSTGRKELEREFEKTMRYRSIRDLSDDETGLVIQDLKPVWLMSPLSVSDTQPLATKNFDVVIFDEASQIPLEEGVPAIYRAEQAIIVGDQMQLPPTSFFSSRGGEEEELAEGDGPESSEYDLSSNSFLAFAARTLPSTMLGWHYRSRSESLISFSNARFYEGRLLTVPEAVRAVDGRGEIRVVEPPAGGANVDQTLDRPLSFHFLEKGVYDQRRNASEAEYIAHLVRALLAKGTGLSLGVVAFSEAQQGEIEGALEALAKQDPEFRDRLEREYEREEDGQFLGLLVKNLENIQGDERDLMILSVCYARGPEGKMLMNFGPINQSGGEKRLNVAFSRAKRHMAVVSSIQYGDITNEYNDGANCLRNYLRYVEAASCGDERSAGRVLDELLIGGPRAASATRADAVAAQLARELETRGYETDLGVGHSGLKCDLAVRRKGERAYLAAVLVDTPDAYGDEDILSRDLMKPSLLRSFGWRVHLILAKDWLADRAGVLNRLEGVLRGEAAAEESLELPAAPTRSVGRSVAPVEPDAKPEAAPLPAVTTGARRFTFVEGGSSKFWEIAVEGTRTTVRFGRIGTAGQTLTKEFASPVDAARDADRLVREKTAKGYKEG